MFIVIFWDNRFFYLIFDSFVDNRVCLVVFVFYWFFEREFNNLFFFVGDRIYVVKIWYFGFIILMLLN